MKKTEFENAYETYSEAIFRYCAIRISDRERAKELMQDVFAQSWKYIVAGNKIENIQAFLYRVAHNMVVTELSRRKKNASLEAMREETGFDPATETDSTPEERDDRTRIVALLEELDETSAEILRLKYIEEMSNLEIAEILESNENAVRVQLHRARKKLKALYDTKYGTSI